MAPVTTREALVIAAADLVDAGGPAAVTLRAVAQAVGVSHNAPYKHFADKEALLAAVAARELRAGADAIRAAGAAEVDAFAALKAIARGHVQGALAHPERFRLTYGGWSREEPELRAAAGEAHDLFVRAVAAAQASGALKAGDPERIAALLMALGHGATDMTLAGHLSREGKGHADAGDLVDDLFALLGA